MTDAGGLESDFESWLTLNEAIINAIDALKALDKQEPTYTMLRQKQESIEGLNRDYDLLFAEHQLLLKKEWVGLTNKEFDEIYDSYGTVERAMKAVETKLKDKNTKGQE